MKKWMICAIVFLLSVIALMSTLLLKQKFQFSELKNNQNSLLLQYQKKYHIYLTQKNIFLEKSNILILKNLIQKEIIQYQGQLVWMTLNQQTLSFQVILSRLDRLFFLRNLLASGYIKKIDELSILNAQKNSLTLKLEVYHF